MKVYRIKKIINGIKVGLVGDFVAVPDIDYDRNLFYDDGETILVRYKNQEMLIEDFKKAKTYRTFGDRLNRGTYRLGYFKWTGGEK